MLSCTVKGPNARAGDDTADPLFLISVGLGLLPSCFSWDCCCEVGGGNTW